MEKEDFIKFKDAVCLSSMKAVMELYKKTKEEGGNLVVGDHEGQVKILHFPGKRTNLGNIEKG